MADRNLLHNRWTPPEDTEMAPTQKILHRTYQMLVSRSMVMTPEYANLLGVIASTPDREAVSRHAMIESTLNAPRIAEVFAIGGRPMFKDVKLSVRLYKDLCDYLFAFKAAYENETVMLQASDTMMSNILKLENLAEWVYGIAQPYFPPEEIMSSNSLAGRFGRGRFTRGIFAKKTQEPQEVQYTGPIVTIGIPEDAPIHGRITDQVQEQHFSEKQRVKAKGRGGWS